MPEAEAWSATGVMLAMDSEEASPNAPVFAWDDIAATGQLIAQGDDIQTQVVMPFAFTYYGQPSNVIWVCSNGYLQHNQQAMLLTAFAQIPNAGTPNSAVYGWSDDILLNGGARSQTLGTAPNQRHVVSWINAPSYFDGSEYNVTFQITLFAQGNAIRIQYQSITGPQSGGQGCQIGIEDQTGGQGILYQWNGNPATNNTYNNLAIGFWPQGSTPPWFVAPPPPPPPSGGNTGGATSNVDVKKEKREHSFCGGAAAGHSAFLVLAMAIALAAGFFVRRGA